MAQKLKEKWRVLCDFLTLWKKTLHFLRDARDSPNSGTQKLRQSTQRRKVWLEKCYKHQIFWLSRFGECPFQPQHFPTFVQKEQLSTKNREALNSHILKTSWALSLGCNLPPPPPLLQATHWTRTNKSNFQETFQDGPKEQNPKAPTTTEPALVPFPPHQKNNPVLTSPTSWGHTELSFLSHHRNMPPTAPRQQEARSGPRTMVAVFFCYCHTVVFNCSFPASTRSKPSNLQVQSSCLAQVMHHLCLDLSFIFL